MAMEDPKLREEIEEMRLNKQKLKKAEASHEVGLAALAISLNVRLRSSDMPLPMQEHALRYTASLLHHPSPSPSSSSSKPRHNPTHLARSLKKVRPSMFKIHSNL